MKPKRMGDNMMVILQELMFVTVTTLLAMGLALLLTNARRRSSADMRHRVLAITSLFVLAFPLLLPLYPAPALKTVHLPQFAVSVYRPEQTREPSQIQESDSIPIDARSLMGRWSNRDLLIIITLVWLAGVLVLGYRLIHIHHRANRLCRDATPMQDPESIAIVSRLISVFGIRRNVELRRSPAIPSPVTAGLFHPKIILPSHSVDWGQRETETILRHELAHVGRGDNLHNLIASLVVVFHWCNPLAWLTWRQMRREAEQACDDAVIRGGVCPSFYARFLLSQALECKRQERSITIAALPFAGRTKQRLTEILNPATDRRIPGRVTNYLMACVFLFGALPLTALRPSTQLVESAAISAELGAVDELRTSSLFATIDDLIWESSRQFNESQALRALKTDPSRATVIPETWVDAPDGSWSARARGALALEGSKYGCVFPTGYGFVEVVRHLPNTTLRYRIEGRPHQPGAIDLLISDMLDLVNLGPHGQFQAYIMIIDEDDSSVSFDRQRISEFRLVLTELTALLTGN